MSISELITNGGFENWTGSDIDDWTDNAGGGSIDKESTNINSGSYAVKMVSGSALDTYVYQDITVTAGSMYRLSFYTRGDGTYDGRYWIYDTDNAADIVSVTDTGITGTTYTAVQTRFKAPTGCTTVRIYLYCPDTNTGVSYFDDVSAVASDWEDDTYRVTTTAKTNMLQLAENLRLLKTFLKGEVAPSNPEAGMPWLDKSASTWVMKQRDKTNSSWLELWDLASAEVPKGKIDTHIADNITSSNTVHGIRQGTGNSLDGDTVDGYEAQDLIDKRYIHADAYYSYAGTDTFINASNDASFTDASYTKQKEITLRATPGATLRIVFDLRTENGAETVYGKIYRNGAAVGTERSHTGNTDWDTQSTEDIAGWSSGDLLQAYCYITGGATGHIRNFKVLYQKAVECTLD